MRILLSLVDDDQPARHYVVVQVLGFLVNLAVTASTEERYSKVLPHMAESSSCVLIHYPAVRAECNLFALVGVIQDGDPIHALRFVEFVDHILPLILKIHLREDHGYKRTGLMLV